MIRLGERCPCRGKSGKSLTHLGEPLFSRPLLAQRPPAQDRSDCQPQCEPFFLRQHNLLLGILLARLLFLTVLVKPRSGEQREPGTKGMGQLPRQREGVVAFPERLIWIAEKPPG